MTKPGPSVTSGADTQPGSDSLFPTGFGGGGANVRPGGVGTSEIADGSVAAADLNLPSVAAAIAARSELTGTYAQGLSLGVASGTDDTTAINAQITAAAAFGVQRVFGKPGEAYQVSSPIITRSGVTLDLTGATVTLKAGSGCNILNNTAVTAVRAVSDGAISASGTTLTSATANFTSADVGRSVNIAGANSGGYLLTTTIASVTNSSTAVVAATAGTTVSGATVTLYNRDSNIKVIGGTWALGNNSGGTGINLHGMLFRHIDGLTVRDMTITSTGGKYAISIADATKVRVTGIDYNVFSAGVQFGGPCTGVTVRDITGTFGDDCVAFTPQDWTAYADMVGDITDVVVENIEPTTTAAAVVTALSGASGALKHVRIRNVGGVSTNASRGAVFIGNDPAQAGTATGTWDDVEIDGIYARVPNGAPLVNHRGINSGTCRIKGLFFDNANATVSQIVQLSPAATSTLTEVAIIDPVVLNCGTARLVNVPSNLTVSCLKIHGARILSASGNNIVFSQGAVTDLLVHDLRFVIGAVAGSVIDMDQNTGTVTTTRAVFSNCELTGANAGQLIRAIHASHTLPYVRIIGCHLNAIAWLTDLNCTSEFEIIGTVVSSPGSGILNARANTVLTLNGGAGNSIAVGSNGIKITAGGKVANRLIDTPPSTQTGGFPTIAAGAGAGTGPTVAVAGSDRAGTVTVTPGTSPAAGAQATVTFIGTWPQTPKLALTPTNAAAQAAGGYLSAKSTTTFTVSAANTPGGAMTFDYVVLA